MLDGIQQLKNDYFQTDIPYCGKNMVYRKVEMDLENAHRINTHSYDKFGVIRRSDSG